MKFAIKIEKANAAKSIPSGVYDAEITDVSWDDSREEPEEAFRVSYTLTDNDGNTYKYSEVFMTSAKNKRTAEFYEYISNHAIHDLCDLVGVKEKVTIERREGRTGKKFPSIVAREFLR